MDISKFPFVEKIASLSPSSTSLYLLTILVIFSVSFPYNISKSLPFLILWNNSLFIFVVRFHNYQSIIFPFIEFVDITAFKTSDFILKIY